MTAMLLFSLLACFPQATSGPVPEDSGADSAEDSAVDTSGEPSADTAHDSGADSGHDSAEDTDSGGDDTAAVGDTHYAAGDVFINEFMANSHPIEDTYGEWVELVNLTGRDLDLKGMTLGDLDGTAPQLVTIEVHLKLAAHGFVVLGNSADSDANGGVDVAWAWDAAVFQLGNDGDEIVLTAASGIIDSVSYEEAAWGMVKGSAEQRDADHLDPAGSQDASQWCAGTSTFGAEAQVGTPGSANDDCGK